MCHFSMFELVDRGGAGSNGCRGEATKAVAVWAGIDVWEEVVWIINASDANGI